MLTNNTPAVTRVAVLMRLVFKPKEITMKENQRWIQGVLAISALAFSGLAASATTMLQMPTGGVTGTYYMIGSPFAQYINQHSSNVRVPPTPSFSEDPRVGYEVVITFIS